MQTPLIEFRKVHKRFGDKVVLDGADLSIYPGEVTTLIGKSGVGKSVTLKLIIGLVAPDSGEILYRGKPVSRMRRGEWEQVRREVHFMFQNNALFDSLSVYDNIALPLQEASRAHQDSVRERVRGRMRVLELEGTENYYPSQLSGGMQKRVALARALVTDPETVLFDEPTTGLDPLRKNSVLSLITRNQQEFGFTAVLVSHDVPDVFYISNRIAVIEGGRIIYQGPPQEMEHREHPVLQEYVHSQEMLQNEIYGLQSFRRLERSFLRLQQDSSGGGYLFLFRLPQYYFIKERYGNLMLDMILGSIARIFSRASENESSLITRYRDDRIICLCPETGKEVDPDSILGKMQAELSRTSFCTFGMSLERANFTLTAGWDRMASDRSMAQQVEEISERERLLATMQCGGL